MVVVLISAVGYWRLILLTDHIHPRTDGYEQNQYAVLHADQQPITPEYHAARNIKLGEISTNSLQSGMPTIIAGDFNASPWSSAFAGSELKRATGLASTWPSGLFGIAVDQVLASEQWHVYDFYVGSDTGSDHLPVIATLYGAGIAKKKPDSLLEELGIDLSENKKGSTFQLSLLIKPSVEALNLSSEKDFRKEGNWWTM